MQIYISPKTRKFLDQAIEMTGKTPHLILGAVVRHALPLVVERLAQVDDGKAESLQSVGRVLARLEVGDPIGQLICRHAKLDWVDCAVAEILAKTSRRRNRRRRDVPAADDEAIFAVQE